MRTVKLGIIGCGGIAQAHCKAMSQVEGVEIIAGCDIIEERAINTGKRWGFSQTFLNYHDLLAMDELDAVLVCTPTAVHGAPTVAALKAGKHVFSEKPMEASLSAATEMVATAHETGNTLMVGLKLRYTPQVIKAREIIQSGALGEIYYAETVADRRRGNPGGTFIKKDTAGFGAAADIGVYALDTALYLMGHPKPVAVSGMASNTLSLNNTWNESLKKTEVEDFATGWVLFDNGTRLVFKTCWCMNMDSLGGTIFLGTEGGLRIGVGEVRGPQEGVTLYRDEFGQPTDVKVPTPGNVDVFVAEDTAFVDAVREGKPSPIDPDGILLTNVIFQGVMDSAAAGGREVEVSVPTF
jgi:predicted dehydrogenase